MPNLDHAAMANYAKKKKEEDEKKKKVEASSSSQIEVPVIPTTGPQSPRRVVPITMILPKDASPRKRQRAKQATSTSQTAALSSILTGLESFKVDNPTTAYLFRNSAGVLLKALMSYAMGIGSKVAKERDSLRSNMSKLKKTCADLKKLAKDAESTKKKAEDDLARVQKEKTDLAGQVANLDSRVKELEMQKAELEQKMKEDAEAATKKASDLGKDIKDLNGECMSMFEDGYNYCISHVKFLSLDFDTLELSFTKKIEDGKLVEAAS